MVAVGQVLFVYAGQLTKDSDKNTGKNEKKGINSVITPDKAQHNTACAVYISEYINMLYTYLNT